MFFSAKGIGVDLVRIERLQKITPRTVARLFTIQEIAECSGPRRFERLAGKFAAKESVLKALGTGLASGMRWHDVEILTSASGSPTVELKGEAGRRLLSMGAKAVMVSISHEGGLAMAAALVVDS